jgi:hypothetical protein
LDVARLTVARDPDVNRAVGSRELATEDIDRSNPLTAERGDYIALAEAGVVSRRARIDALDDDAVWRAVVNNEAVLIERVVVDDGLLERGGLEDKDLLATIAEDDDFDRAVDVRSRQDLDELIFACHAAAIDRDDPVVGAEAGGREDAIVRNVIDNQALVAAGVEPDAEISSAAGLETLSDILTSFASFLAGRGARSAGVTHIVARLTRLLAGLAASGGGGGSTGLNGCARLNASTWLGNSAGLRSCAGLNAAGWGLGFGLSARSPW